MAEAKKAEAAETEQAPKKNKKLLVMIMVAVLLVVVIGGAAAFFLMKGKAAADAGDEEGDEPAAQVEKTKKTKHDNSAPPAFVKLEAFTVKLQTEQQDAYLQVIPELRVLDIHIGDKVKQYTPEIRHKVTLILMGKKASEISTPQGVQKLANEMRVAINAIIEPPAPKKKKGKNGDVAAEPEEPTDQAGPDEPVQAVLFTSFIVQ